MKITLDDAVKALNEIAFFLEVKGENSFKIRSYHETSRNLSLLGEAWLELLRSGELKKRKGFANSILDKVIELEESGKIIYLENLRQEFPSTILELAEIPGVGPKKINLFYHQLNIDSMVELEKACADGRVAKLPGMGVLTCKNILSAIKQLRINKSFFLYRDAQTIADSILKQLKHSPHLCRVAVAGGLRRYKEFTKKIIIIVSAKEPSLIIAEFVTFPEIQSILSQSNTKVSVQLHNGIQVKMRVVTEQTFPHALHFFTGNKKHIKTLCSWGKNAGLKVTKQGLHRISVLHDKNSEIIYCKDEIDIYHQLGLNYILPELREDQGEIAFAEHTKIPPLVGLNDYCGILHCHSLASDGSNSLEELYAHAQLSGHLFLGITDHSKSSFQANGLSEDRLLNQIQQIKHLNARINGRVTLFSGIECDILSDGRLDYNDELLGQLDFVVVSIHSGFSQSNEAMTARIIRALEHPRACILAHPSGRLLLKRNAYEIDYQRIIDAAIANRVAIEFNCNPMRMDLDWRWLKYAKDKEALFSINPDAHNLSHFNFIADGIGFCRKGWLEPHHIINCWAVDKLKELFLSKNY